MKYVNSEAMSMVPPVKLLRLAAAVLSSLLLAPGLRAEEATDAHAGHHAEAHAGHSISEPMTDSETASDEDTGMVMDHMDMDHMDMGQMDMGSMQGGRPPANARDPHANSGGQDFGPHPLKLGDTHNFASLLAENFEVARSKDNTTMAYDLQGWYGGIYNRAVIKAEGDIDGGGLEDARTELLWSLATRPYWDTQIGVRYDSGEGPERSWLALGLQGLAPYWFEADIVGYVGESGRTALRLDFSYDLPLTQKLILQPNIEADLYGKNDPQRGLGSGLSSIDTQLRLRYEFRREFAPYIGISWAQKFGETRDIAKQAGDDSKEIQFVAGLRFWF